MEILKLTEIKNKEIIRISCALATGKILVLPTETCYGYSTRFDLKSAAKKIAKLKGRKPVKKFISLVKNRQMAEKYAEINVKRGKLLANLNKKPLTLVFRKKGTRNEETIALRISSHSFIKNLFRKIDFPLISSSVNKNGQKPIYRAQDILAKPNLTKNVAILVDAGVLPKIPPSTILDLSKKQPKILRQGSVNKKSLAKIIHGL